MQTRQESFVEQLYNTTLGFIISLIFWSWVVVPVWNLDVSTNENLAITASFTALSIARGYVVRRWFNWKAVKRLAAR